MNAQPQNNYNGTAPSAHEWLKSNPILLPVTGGKVYKKDMAVAVSLSPRNLRHRLAPILDGNLDLKERYKVFLSKKWLSLELAETFVREMYDHNESLDIQYRNVEVIPVRRKKKNP